MAKRGRCATCRYGNGCSVHDAYTSTIFPTAWGTRSASRLRPWLCSGHLGIRGDEAFQDPHRGPLCLCFAEVLHRAEAQGPGRAGVHTGRVHAVGDPVDAEVALPHFLPRMEPGGSKGADHGAGPAPDAQVLVPKTRGTTNSAPFGHVTFVVLS
jgi:hypothetical protein